MTDFLLWFTEGFWHIVDINAYDHILFLLVLFGGIGAKDWKKMLWLVTAFTVGHSITLALSVLFNLHIRTYFVELLIPCTIIATATYSLMNRRAKTKAEGLRNIYVQFFMTLFFGTIHGLGFSTLLRSLLGRAENIVGPLFSFNLGIEAGQLIIIGIIFAITLLITKALPVSSRNWRIFLSAGGFVGALVMALVRI